MAIICALDQTEHATVADLHAHLRRFRISQARYYESFTPRRDRLTGELIPFKDYEQYQEAEFTSKVTLRKWLAQNREEGLVWVTEWLRRRKEEKGLTYAPSQAELRTLMCPGMAYYESVAAHLGGYYGVTAKLGYAPRFVSEPVVVAPIAPDATVIVDTREQEPLRLGAVPTVRRTLTVGDYALAAPHDLGTRIERKSLADFCGTMSGRQVARKKGADSSFARFCREMDRAVESDLYVVMMVESDINDAQRFGYLPQTRHIKARPEYIMHQMREVLALYPLHLQVLFVAGRIEMAAKMMRVFQMGTQVRRVDLEWAYEKGDL